MVRVSGRFLAFPSYNPHDQSWTQGLSIRWLHITACALIDDLCEYLTHLHVYKDVVDVIKGLEERLNLLLHE